MIWVVSPGGMGGGELFASFREGLHIQQMLLCAICKYRLFFPECNSACSNETTETTVTDNPSISAQLKIASILAQQLEELPLVPLEYVSKGRASLVITSTAWLLNLLVGFQRKMVLKILKKQVLLPTISRLAKYFNGQKKRILNMLFFSYTDNYKKNYNVPRLKLYKLHTHCSYSEVH